MKILYIIRHAKSDWSTTGQPDIDRQLASRGLTDAPMMAELLKQKGVLPEVLISSPAVRANTTCNIFSGILNMPVENIIVHPELYFGDILSIHKLVFEAFKTTNTLAIFGHNPTFSLLANYFTPEFDRDMPTCAIVAITFANTSEMELMPDGGELLWFEYPKKYR